MTPRDVRVEAWGRSPRLTWASRTPWIRAEAWSSASTRRRTNHESPGRGGAAAAVDVGEDECGWSSDNGRPFGGGLVPRMLRLRRPSRAVCPGTVATGPRHEGQSRAHISGAGRKVVQLSRHLVPKDLLEPSRGSSTPPRRGGSSATGRRRRCAASRMRGHARRHGPVVRAPTAPIAGRGDRAVAGPGVRPRRQRPGGALRRRELARIHPGIYVDHTGPATWSQRAWAATLFHWPAALAGPSALRAHGLRSFTGGGRADAWTDKGSRFGRVAAVEPVHVVVDASRRVVPPSGVVVTRRSDFESRVLSDACQEGATTASRLRATLAARGRLPRRRLLLAILDDIANGTMSVLERRYLSEVERAHGLPTARRQVRAVTRWGVTYRDVEYPELGSSWSSTDGSSTQGRRASGPISSATSTPRAVVMPPCDWVGPTFSSPVARVCWSGGSSDPAAGTASSRRAARAAAWLGRGIGSPEGRLRGPQVVECCRHQVPGRTPPPDPRRPSARSQGAGGVRWSQPRRIAAPRSSSA